MQRILIFFLFFQIAQAQELLNLVTEESDDLILIEEDDLTSDSFILDEDEEENLKVLREKELESVNQIINSKFNNYDQTQKEVVKIKTEDILKSPLFKGYINKDAVLYNLITRKQEVLTKNSFVKAYSLLDDEGYYYLQNENGTVTYKVRESDLAQISLISNMYEPPKKFVPVIKEKKEFNLKDKSLSISPIFNYHTGRTRPTFLRDLTNDSTHTGTISRFELKTMGNFNFPVNIGLSLLYTDIKANIGATGEKYNLNSLAIGPTISITNIMEDLIDINFIASVHSSIFSQLRETRLTQTLDYTLTQTMILLGVEKQIDLFIGKAMLGANFQRQWSKASSDEFNADVNSQNNHDDSYALSLGWGFDWDIY